MSAPVRVGIIGVGAMGRGFAYNLLKAGFEVIGFDTEARRLEELVGWGGTAAGSASAAAHASEVLLTSLPTPEIVEQAVFGEGGAAAGAKAGSILIDTTTSLPAQSRRLAERLAERGIRFVDASVSGTGATVMERDVVLLVGGAAEDVSALGQLFGAIARRVHHLGPTGSGALGKLVINVAVVGNRLALAEALSFGIATGMDAATVLEILRDGPSASQAMEIRGEKMVRRDYTPQSTLSQSLHGTDLLIEEARRVGAPLFLTSLYAQIAQVAVGLGYGDADPAALIEAMFALSARPKADG